ncbi:uncharacterized protein b6 [Anabrus simplex]|uniref:uncharacterized protein b6 n=1 Tax=Anabrus simplex TaxID=316456 RepID=UPI0034DD6568
MLSTVAVVVLALVAGACGEAVVSQWRPSVGIDTFKPYLIEPEGDQCAVYKVSFNQDLYFQYIQYKEPIPELLQFTLCMWVRFTNHSNDHPLFSYAVGDQPRAILSWVSNSQRSSYLSLSVMGHTFYRLNYPFRLYRWYHSCQSWNGKTGEWQTWVNAERVGRGFHNRLVGYVVPGGGVALSGQEQRQVGGGFLEGPESPKGSGGMLGEITHLYLYSAALAPGKAHKDHKHHHGNHYETNPANGQRPSTPAPVPQFQHPLLVGGQLAPNLRVAEQLAGNVRPVGEQVPVLLPIPLTAAFSDLQQHQLFKRNEVGGKNSTGIKAKRQIPQTLLEDVTGLGLGLTTDFSNPLSLPEDVLLAKGKAQENYPREPAEGEVLQVMGVCSGCDREPFRKALVISWRSTPKKLYSGALYSPATPECRKF